LKRDKKIDKDDKKVDASTCRCVDCQSTYEELVEEIEKNNKQT
jgi:hypothetical protein